MDTKNFQFEICANNVESCLAAQVGGAHRVELCAGIPEGGTTPSYGEIVMARKVLDKTKLHIIIRPRGGDFTYTFSEIQRMIIDIKVCKQLNVDGVVFGCLTNDGNIDMELNAMLLKHCQGLSVTFHRAFDRCRNPFKALDQLAILGFNRILTSGQQPTVELGTPLLHQLQTQADHRIHIIAGCGVNENNIFKIYTETGVREYHFSAREKFLSSATYMNSSVYMGAQRIDENSYELTTTERVKKTISALIDNL